MKPRLIVHEERQGFRLTWQFEYDLGGNLGDLEASELEDAGERAELAAMNDAATKTAATIDQYGFRWDTVGAARAALRAVNAAAKAVAAQRSETPWPDWAIKSLAAGWKPPKGWKP